MLRLAVVFALIAVVVCWPDCSQQLDGHLPYNGTASAKGAFGPPHRYVGMFQGHPLVAWVPSTGADKFPLFVFMHGSTGQVEMYEENLANYASHGFVVVFPYVKDAKQDKNPLTTNTNGEFILHGIDWANNQSSSNATSPMFGKVDMSNIVVAGHSMGATCSIMAALRASKGDKRVPPGSIKLMSTQHPGICGPFGPPPWPATWLKSDLTEVVSAFPTLFTTATNDGAFWPAPQTAKHELGCWQGGVPDNGTHPATFVQFKKSACLEDGVNPPGFKFDDSGHDCPFKNGVESPWVLTAAKLYAQQGGSTTSKCAEMLYGNGDGSMAKDGQVEQFIVRSSPL